MNETRGHDDYDPPVGDDWPDWPWLAIIGLAALAFVLIAIG
jgi:hypothetical protein